MVVIDLFVLLVIVGAIAYLGYASGRAVGRREAAADSREALRRSLLLDLQTRASLDPAYEPRFVEMVERILRQDPPRGPD